MALKLDQVADFIGRISAPNSAYPFGSAKDESSAGAGDGTPYIKARADDVFGMQQSLLTAGGITPNNNPDSVTNPQYLAALSALGWSQYANYRIGSRVLREGAWYQATAANGPDNGGAVDPLAETATWADVGAVPLGLNDRKSDYDKAALELDGTTLKASQNIYVTVNGLPATVATGEVVTLPTLSNATDYKVYAAADGALSAQEYDTPAPANSTLIGGFHAAYSDAAINPHSIWDFAWKPATGSPRAMALSLSKRVWGDIYLMDSDYGINGHSRPDAQIADGGSPPKRPLAYGGDGSATYSNFTQYVAKEMAAAAGKRLPNYDEFADVAYGTVTGQVAGSDPVTTKHQAGLRSAVGIEQATGAVWQWGQENWDRGNGASGYAWYAADTDGGGQVYTTGSSGVGASVFGGTWIESGQSGPRCSDWIFEPWDSSSGFSARAVSDHKKHV